MKVLLVGEYSGVHTNLKKGLEKFGVDVLLISEGDAWKKFNSDILLYCPENTKWKKYYNRLMIQKCCNWAKDADVVQFINPSCLYIVNKKFTGVAFELMKRAKVSVSVLAGCDCGMADYQERIIPYICPTCLQEMKKRNWTCFIKSDAAYRKYEEAFYKRIDCLVPGEWACYKVYHDYVKKYNRKMTRIIPYPIDCNAIHPVYNQHDKIVVHFPLNAAKKGTLVVKKAFGILRKKYRDRLLLEVRGHMPIEKYLEYLNGIDIIVDGVGGYSCGLGMSCLMAMAKGKAAVGVRDQVEEGDRSKWLLESPQVDPGYGEDGIVKAVESIISDPERLYELQKESREFVKKYFDAPLVAKQYIKLYKQLLDRKNAQKIRQNK